MGVDEEFERVRTALRTEEQALAQEFERIDAEARATIDASVEHVRTELATQADRIREAIAQQRAEVEARTEELGEELTEAAAGSATPTPDDDPTDDDPTDHDPTDPAPADPTPTADGSIEHHPADPTPTAETSIEHQAVEEAEDSSRSGRGADADADTAVLDLDETGGDVTPGAVSPADYPDDIEWDEDPVDDAARNATQVEQADGTEVDRMTSGGDDVPPAGTVDGVERGD